MNGVKFGSYHSYQDLGMVLSSKEIGTPEVQTNYVEVPGMNGVLDLTEVLTGDVRYKTRIITLTFSTCKNISGVEWADFLSGISNKIHGQRMKIIFDDDADWYWMGRCTIDSFKTSQGLQTVVISAACDPFKISVTDSDTTSL